MNEEKAIILFDAITGIREEYIEAAARPCPKRHVTLTRASALIAACICLFLAYSLTFGFPAFVNRLHLPSLVPGGSAGGGGGKDGAVYGFYAGPVLPLAAEDGTGLTAERSVDFDFSPFDPNRTETEGYLRFREYCAVTDRYLLSVPDGEERTVTLLYPFVASVAGNAALLPTVTVNGEAVETELLIGPGGMERDMEKSLFSLNSWEDCKALMAGDYAAEALAPLPRLTDRVIVYELSEMWGEKSETAPAPTLNMEFSMDYAKTAVLTLGFNGGSNDREAGRCERGVFIAEHGEAGYGRSVYLLVLGEDIRDLTLRGYVNGACEIPMEAGGTVTRRESTLEETLDRIWDGYRADYLSGTLASLLDRETLPGLTAAWMLRYDAVEGSAVPYEQSGDWGLEDTLEQVLHQDRVMYLRFILTVPAGETAEVEAKLLKYPSVDFAGKERYRRGFDLATKLGSSITFTKQEASLSGTEYIAILRQNFGFDLSSGVLQVTLDPAEEHWFLDVEAKKQS